MKIAIPHWQGRISPVFDVSNELCLLRIEKGREIERHYYVLTHWNVFKRTKEMCDLGVNVLLCGAVSNALETALISSGIRVVGFLCGDLNEVVHAFLQGESVHNRFLMPGALQR